MKRTQRIFCLCALLLATTPVLADTLETLSRRIAAIESVSGGFEQSKAIDVLSRPLVSSGRFRYQRGEGLTWHTEEPIVSRLEITPDGAITLEAEQGERAPEEVLPEQMAQLFLALFAGDFERLRDYFAVEVGSPADPWRLTLSPATETMADFVTRVTIVGTDTVDEVKVVESNGDTTTIDFEVHELSRSQDE